jgi:hypothetical protein
MAIDWVNYSLLPLGAFFIWQSGYQCCKHKDWLRVDVLLLHFIGVFLIAVALHKP